MSVCGMAYSSDHAIVLPATFLRLWHVYWGCYMKTLSIAQHVGQISFVCDALEFSDPDTFDAICRVSLA